MIHCSAFAVFSGEGASDAAARSIRRVERRRERVLVDYGDGFKDFGEGAAKSEKTIVVFDLGGGNEELPANHGPLTRSGESTSGEFSLLEASDGVLFAGRDPVGTRPLFFRRGSPSVVASDHRFLPDLLGARLLGRGERVSIADGSSTTEGLPRNEAPQSLEGASKELAALTDESVRKRVAGKRRVAVSFSGGLDSSLVANVASRYSEVVLCSAHTKGARDESQARWAASLLGLELLEVEVGQDEMNRELRGLDLPYQPNPMDRALWTVYSACSRTASRSGAEMILLGQLADELFGGYMKYQRALAEGGAIAAERMMSSDVEGCSRTGFLRDEQACSRWVEPSFPFADGRIVSFGLSADTEFKIMSGRRKVLLGEAARILGLPDEIVDTPKRAAQYSSGLSKLVSA